MNPFERNDFSRFNDVPLPVIITGSSLCLLYANPAARLRYPLILSPEDFSVYYHSSTRAQIIARLMDGVPCKGRFEKQTAGSALFEPVLDAQGNFLYAQVFPENCASDFEELLFRYSDRVLLTAFRESVSKPLSSAIKTAQMLEQGLSPEQETAALHQLKTALLHMSVFSMQTSGLLPNPDVPESDCCDLDLVLRELADDVHILSYTGACPRIVRAGPRQTRLIILDVLAAILAAQPEKKQRIHGEINLKSGRIYLRLTSAGGSRLREKPIRPEKDPIDPGVFLALRRIERTGGTLKVRPGAGEDGVRVDLIFPAHTADASVQLENPKPFVYDDELLVRIAYINALTEDCKE